MKALKVGKRSWIVGMLAMASAVVLQGQALYAATPCDPIDPFLRPSPLSGEPPPSRLIVLSGNVTLTVLRGETADFDNLVGLASPADTDLYLSKAADEGDQFDLGSFAAGTELVFRITTPQGATYFTGPGDRNPDSLVHANVVQISENIFWVGWEDLFGGGDSDYDDVFVQLCGEIAITTIEVSVDIKPGSDPNSINPHSNGKIPVAILSTGDFNAANEVDRASLTFGKTGDEKSLHLRGRSGVPNCGEEDVNGDGLSDLVCHFSTQAAGFARGDTEGILKGMTIAGDTFLGIDEVRTVPH
jgi:hypothetical protein